MHPEVMSLLANEHQAELARSAAWKSQVERARTPRPDRDPADDGSHPIADPRVPERHLLPQLEA